MKAPFIVLGLIVCANCASAWQGSGALPRDNQAVARNPTNSIPTLSRDDEYQLLRIKALQDSEDELTKWAQTRFWIFIGLSVVVGVIGLIGIRSLVREMLATELRDAMSASADAKAAAAQGHEAIGVVRAEATKYRELMETLSTTAKTLDEKLQEIRSRIDAEGVRTSAGSDLKIAALDQQLTEIRGVVTRLAAESHPRVDLTEALRKLGESRQSAASNQAEFQDNSKFNVVVVSHGPGTKTEALASSLVSALSHAGFKASMGMWGEWTKEHELIEIDFVAPARSKLGTIRALLQEKMKEHNDGRSIRTRPKPQQLPGTTPKDNHDVRIFL